MMCVCSRVKCSIEIGPPNYNPPIYQTYLCTWCKCILTALNFELSTCIIRVLYCILLMSTSTGTTSHTHQAARQLHLQEGSCYIHVASAHPITLSIHLVNNYLMNERMVGNSLYFPCTPTHSTIQCSFMYTGL